MLYLYVHGHVYTSVHMRRHILTYIHICMYIYIYIQVDVGISQCATLVVAAAM